MYPELHVYSHLVEVQEATMVFGVLAVKPVSSPLQIVALVGVVPVQLKFVQELESDVQVP